MGESHVQFPAAANGELALFSKSDLNAKFSVRATY